MEKNHFKFTNLNEIFDIILSDDLFATNVCNGNTKYVYDEKEKEHSYLILAPGFKKDDISIEFINNEILIKGEIKDENIKKHLLKTKFNYALRKDNVNVESIKANLEDGVLKISYKEDEKNKRKINID